MAYYYSWLIFGLCIRVKAIVRILEIENLESRFVHCVEENGLCIITALCIKRITDFG